MVAAASAGVVSPSALQLAVCVSPPAAAMVPAASPPVKRARCSMLEDMLQEKVAKLAR